ncbi:MAG: hypothetical protein AAGC82_01590 [Pseudomonadota bacterium]
MKKFLLPSCVLIAGAATAATMAELDANADGMVSYEEISAVMPEIGTDLFDVIDANQDGMIDEDELTVATESGLLPAS